MLYFELYFGNFVKRHCVFRYRNTGHIRYQKVQLPYVVPMQVSFGYSHCNLITVDKYLCILSDTVNYSRIAYSRALRLVHKVVQNEKCEGSSKTWRPW